ncbi:MAG: sigma-70 family RNA polymerase sigma factor [Bacillota bacterium]
MPATKNNNYHSLVKYIEENQNRFYLLAFSYVKDQDIALDMVQESVYKALKAADHLKDSTYLKTWFYRILINVCLDEIRKSKYAIATDPITFSEQDLCNNPNQEDLSRAELMDLYETLNSLEPKAKTIITLRYFEDMKLADIAEVLEENISTVKSILYRTLDLLKVQLKGDVFQDESMG